MSSQRNLRMENYAFIDGNNLHLGVKAYNWKVDYRKLKIYLKDKYSVVKAYYFIGYIAENEKLYQYLASAGYELVYKPIVQDANGIVKGNCDAELVLQAMIDYKNYDQAVIVSSDGDFTCLANHLQQNGKLKVVLAPHPDTTSILLKKAITNIHYIENLKNKISK
jgi:uncharacterized LabA/DUF88 family protein